MIERVLAIVDANPAARPDDRSLIWMIRACTGALGPCAESLLLTVATGDDDSTGIGDIKHGERAKEPDWKRAFTLGRDLNGKAINSARGSALEMLGGMCWSSKETFEKYRPILDPIIGVPAAAHETVRHEASDCFRRMRTSDIASHAGLFEAYVASRYFETDRTYFLHRLEYAPPGLDELVLKLLEDTLKARTEGNNDPRAYELHEIGELALKLYASNVDHPLRRTRALDLIDRLVEDGLMAMQKLEAA